MAHANAGRPARLAILNRYRLDCILLSGISRVLQGIVGIIVDVAPR